MNESITDMEAVRRYPELQALGPVSKSVRAIR
jgi:hypothetical protein